MEYDEHVILASGHFLTEHLPEDWHTWHKEKLYEFCENYIAEFVEGYDGKFIMDQIDDAAHATHSYMLNREKDMTSTEFVEEVFEIAFGDNAINRDFSKQEVLSRLRKFSDDALLMENILDLLTSREGS